MDEIEEVYIVQLPASEGGGVIAVATTEQGAAEATATLSLEAQRGLQFTSHRLIQ